VRAGGSSGAAFFIEPTDKHHKCSFSVG